MSPSHSIPPLRDLPPGRLDVLTEGLLHEIKAAPNSRWSWPSITWTPILVAGVAVLSAAVAAAIAVAVTTSGGRGGQATALVHPVSAGGIVPRLAPTYAFHLQRAGSSADLPASWSAYTGSDFAFSQGVARGVPRVVLDLARLQAVANGDRHPTFAQWFKTTRQLAVSSQSSDRVHSGRRPVYFVVLDGRFVDRNAYYLGRGKKGGSAAAPRGTILSFTIDRKTGQILDLALAPGNDRPSYRKVGQPHTFPLGAFGGQK